MVAIWLLMVFHPQNTGNERDGGMKRVTAGLALMVAGISGTAFAGSHVLEKGALICDSEAKYELQVEQIAQKNYQLVPGCGFTKNSVIVTLVSARLIKATEVYVPSIGANAFVDRSSLR